MIVFVHQNQYHPNGKGGQKKCSINALHEIWFHCYWNGVFVCNLHHFQYQYLVRRRSFSNNIIFFIPFNLKTNKKQMALEWQTQMKNVTQNQFVFQTQSE